MEQNENNTNPTVTPNSESSNDGNNGVQYIEAIKTIKENSVSKEAYTQLQEENKRLLSSLINGDTVEAAAEASPDIAELRKELFSAETDLSNLDYMTKVMQLRSAIIEEGGVDPFLPYGKKIVPTDEDVATAERVAQVITECIEYADGDSQVFTNELQRRMIDTSPTKTRKK